MKAGAAKLKHMTFAEPPKLPKQTEELRELHAWFEDVLNKLPAATNLDELPKPLKLIEPATHTWLLNGEFKTVPRSEVSHDLDRVGPEYLARPGLPYLDPDVQEHWARFWETSVSNQGARVAFVNTAPGEPELFIVWEGPQVKPPKTYCLRLKYTREAEDFGRFLLKTPTKGIHKYRSKLVTWRFIEAETTQD